MSGVLSVGASVSGGTDSRAATNEHRHGGDAQSPSAETDFSSELEDLFEEMRRLVGFERISDRMIVMTASKPAADPLDSEGDAAIHNSNVAQQIVRQELKGLLRQLRLVNPFENQTEMRALERKIRTQNDEVLDLTRKLKNSETRASRLSGGGENAVNELEMRAEQLQRQVALAKKNEGQAELKLAGTKDELRQVKKYARKLRDRVAIVEREAQEEKGQAAQNHQSAIAALTDRLDCETRQHRETRKKLEPLEATNKRLEAVVQDVRNELTAQHHLAVTKGMEARQARTLLETLESEYDDVKRDIRAQNATHYGKVREMYDVQESMLHEIKKLQDSKASPQAIRSLAQKTNQLKMLAKVMFTGRSARRLQDGDSMDAVDDNHIGMSDATEVSSSATGAPSPPSPGSPELADVTGSERRRSVRLSLSGRWASEKKERPKKLTTYEASLEKSMHAAEKGVEELTMALEKKETVCVKLEDEVVEIRRKLEISEHKLEELRQNRVREARNFSALESGKSADDVERAVRPFKSSSLFV